MKRRIDLHRLRLSQKKGIKTGTPKGMAFKVASGRGIPIPKELAKKTAIERRIPLGTGLPQMKTVPNWHEKIARWGKNMALLKERVPLLFSKDANYFFNSLKYLGGRKEGVVRELALKNPVIGVDGTKWERIAVKKFQRHSRSSPENQARTLHSMMLIVNYLKANKRIPDTGFEVKVADVLGYNGSFLFMTHLGGENHFRADSERLPQELRRQVKQAITSLGTEISLAKKKQIAFFRKAGLEYPSPDFIPSNIIVKLKGNRIGTLWIFDQFSPPTGKGGLKFLRKAAKRIRQKW